MSITKLIFEQLDRCTLEDPLIHVDTLSATSSANDVYAAMTTLSRKCASIGYKCRDFMFCGHLKDLTVFLMNGIVVAAHGKPVGTFSCFDLIAGDACFIFCHLDKQTYRVSLNTDAYDDITNDTEDDDEKLRPYTRLVKPRFSDITCDMSRVEKIRDLQTYTFLYDPQFSDDTCTYSEGVFTIKENPPINEAQTESTSSKSALISEL